MENYTISEKKYRAIYRLLNMVSPIDSDCGKLCGAVCCADTEDEDIGIYLMPGEEVLHEREGGWLEWDESDVEDMVYVKCPGAEHCRRDVRPIQCRTFPLMPYLSEEGELEMLYDDNELPYFCPLIEEEIPLNDSFVKATRTVWKHLLRDRRIYDMVAADSEETRRAAEDEFY